MIRVYIAPDYSEVSRHADNGGIRRVVEAKVEHLHKFGVEVVHNPTESDVICNNGAMLVESRGIPSVNVSHGMYWSRQPWGDGYFEVNEQLVESMAHAVAHTAPSKWVSNAIRRGGYWYPEVVYHGVDADKFIPQIEKHGNYVLWNKARADYVSDPNDVMELARLIPDIQFTSTIGTGAKNLKIVGVKQHDEMKGIVSNAGLYLSTARETFGIGTLEAMAYGVPVVGWDWGGNSEIIKQGITGYLAKPGDYQQLSEFVKMAFSERDRLSSNCVQDVRANWKWEPRIEQYANIFKRAHETNNAKRPKVSVIVTAYKLDQYLPQCLKSVMAQTFPDWECVVIDDAGLESTELIVSEYKKMDKRITYRPTPNNFGLPGARNFGTAISRGAYIRHLDADDFLAENALELEVAALDNDRGTHIVYGHIGLVNEDGTIEKQRSGWPSPKFDWYQQMAHMNQLPSCVMARREVYERSGGYRERMRRNEDAEFWCRVTSLGFRAKKFTEAITYYHRNRSDSKGAMEWQTQGSEPDWTAWFPWRVGTTDVRKATETIRKASRKPVNPNIVPFGSQGKSPNRFWYVHDFAYPVVSVIVTCGPSHQQYLLDALDSIQAQTFPDWECIVVNDTGAEWGDIMGAPWAKVINTGGNVGTAKARNMGAYRTKGKYIIWLDADDFWFPWTMEKMVSYAEMNDGVIYSDLFMKTSDGRDYEEYKYEIDFDSKKIAKTMQYPGSSIMYPRHIIESVFSKQGGYDANAPGMEDWDFQIAVHDLGFCAYHIPEPLFVYRMYSSTKREQDYAKIEKIREFMDEKWGAYRKGEKQIMCGCNQPRKPIGTPRSALSSSGSFSNVPISDIPDNKNEMVTVEYVGPIAEPFTITSRISRDVRYRFANNQYHSQHTVFLGDAEFLTGLTDKDGKPMYRIVGKNLDSNMNAIAFLSL